MFENYDDVLTTEEVMQILDVGQNTVYKLLNSGKLKGFKIGSVWKIPKISLEKFILLGVREGYLGK